MPSQRITARMETSAMTGTGFEAPAPFTSYAQEGVNISGYASPHFSTVNSPMSFYGPYPTNPTCPPYPPYHQGLQHDAPFQGFVLNSQPTLHFTICFITGNISVCIGYKNKYPKSPKPPQDTCKKHEEWREFTVANTSKQQSKFGNVYYHC